MAEKRKIWLDILKGIGIIAVVIGHVLDVRYVFAFHMPLFFLISGYTFHLRPNIFGYFCLLCKRLLIPYFSFLFLFNFLSLVIWGRRLSFHQFFYGGVSIVDEYAAFWFVTVLFVALLLFELIVKTNINLILFFVFSLIISYYFDYTKINFFWNVQVVPMALVYMIIGYLFHEKSKDICKFLLILCVMTLFCPIFFPEVEMNMKYTNFGIPIISLLISCAISYVLYAVSLGIEQSRWAGVSVRALSYFGRTSMVIMFLHMLVNKLLKMLFCVENKFIIFSLALVLPTLFYACIVRVKILRFLFIGNK